jgi:hypothetical protein
MLKPVGDSILFVFLDDIVGGWFYDKSAAGLFLPKAVETNATQCRWGKVLATGKDVDSLIQPKMNILIDAMRWTVGMDYDGVKVWRTTYPSVVAIDEDSIPA